MSDRLAPTVRLCDEPTCGNGPGLHTHPIDRDPECMGPPVRVPRAGHRRPEHAGPLLRGAEVMIEPKIQMSAVDTALVVFYFGIIAGGLLLALFLAVTG